MISMTNPQSRLDQTHQMSRNWGFVVAPLGPLGYGITVSLENAVRAPMLEKQDLFQKKLYSDVSCDGQSVRINV